MNPTNSAPADPSAEQNRRYNFIAERAFHLRIVEGFLAQIEFTLLKSSSDTFDFEQIKSGLRELKSLGDDAVERRKRIEFQLSHELLLWQEDLAERDSKIEAYHIRRYCDGLKVPLENEIFVALSRFYREQPYTRGSMSKFDLAMTRAFSSQVGELRRCLIADRDTLTSKIIGHFEKWDRQPIENIGSAKDVQVFDRYVDECMSFEDFRLLTESKLFDRVREFKSELGERFFHPSVVAAAVECNIAIGNRLNYLMAKAAENLGERLGSEFDFAGALQDTSPNAGTYIAEVLRDIDSKESLITSESESEDLFLLRSMLDLAAEARDRSERETEEEALNDLEADAQISIVHPEFKRLLGLIDHQNPDVVEIRKRFDDSDAFRKLDFNDFLFLEDGTPDPVSREVLKTILSLESLRAHELNEKREISRDVRKDVMTLVSAAESLGRKLEKALEGKGRSEAGRLLFVSNKLLETRLRMERSIVKFSSRNLGLPEYDHPEDVVIENELISSLSYIDTGTMDANRWLVGATVAVAILCFFLFSWGGTSSAEATFSEDVETLEPAKLPGGKDLTGAHRQGSTLYVVANDVWRRKADPQKSDALENLLRSPAKVKIEAVVVIDSQGQLLADISPKGVNINNDPPANDAEGLR